MRRQKKLVNKTIIPEHEIEKIARGALFLVRATGLDLMIEHPPSSRRMANAHRAFAF